MYLYSDKIPKCEIPGPGGQIDEQGTQRWTWDCNVIGKDDVELGGEMTLNE